MSKQRVVVVVETWDSANPDAPASVRAFPFDTRDDAMRYVMTVMAGMSGFDVEVLTDPDMCEAKATALGIEVYLDQHDDQYWVYRGSGPNVMMLVGNEGSAGVARGFDSADRNNFLMEIPIEDKFYSDSDPMIFITKGVASGQQVGGREPTDEDYEQYLGGVDDDEG